MTLTIVFMSGLFLCRFHADAIRVIVLPHPPPHPMYYCLFIMLPHPHTIREKIRQYNHHSSLELPHYIYIYIYIYFHTFKIQPSKVWTRLCKLCKWTQKLRDKIVSNKTKTVGANNILKHYALNIAYCLWILYDLGFAITLGDTLQSPNRVLAERRRVDSCKSCNWLTIETVETSKR